MYWWTIDDVEVVAVRSGGRIVRRGLHEARQVQRSAASLSHQYVSPGSAILASGLAFLTAWEATFTSWYMSVIEPSQVYAIWSLYMSGSFQMIQVLIWPAYRWASLNMNWPQ